MNLVQIGAALIWLFVFVYAILGAIDFGSSFWRWYFLKRGNWIAESVAETYVSPTWEFINSFLILIPVTMTGLFPKAVFAYGTVLLVPATLLLALIALRGAYWQFGYASRRKRNQTATVVGLTGFILPGVFLSILALSQGGYVEKIDGTLHFMALRFFTSPQVYVFILFGILLALYLSALFLGRYAYQGHQWMAYESFRSKALLLGPLSLLFGFMAVMLPNSFSGMSFASHLFQWWPFALLSVLAFAASQTALLWRNKKVPSGRGKPEWALGAALIQLLIAHFAYGTAHSGYWLYPFVTIAQAASNHTMFTSTMWVLGFGSVLLVPGILWFRRLFIADSRYVKDKAEAS